MSSTTRSYCCLCAGDKYELFNLTLDDKRYAEILKKLCFLNAWYVDLSDEGISKTVCLECCELLEIAYNFLNKVKKAQTILKRFISESTPKSDPSDEFVVIKDIQRFLKKGISLELVKTEEIQIECEYNKTVKIEPTDRTVCLDQNLDIQEYLNASTSDQSTKTGQSPKPECETWRNYPWCCSNCKMTFTELPKLRSHVKMEHGKCFAFACDDCRTVPNNFQEFLAHARMHRNDLRFCCPYCDAIMKSPVTKVNHLKEHYKNPNQVCNLCGEIFTDLGTLKQHITQYSVQEETRRSRRKPKMPYTAEELTCQQCYKVFKCRDSLRNHTKLHTTERLRNHTCDRCGKAFYTKGALVTHFSSHTKTTPHVCRICNKSFLSQSKLRYHIHSHSGIKTFTCDQCGRHFRLYEQMKAHKIIHTNSMPYTCQYCDKSFRFKQNLKNHEYQHTGEKPYGCDICSMKFTNWSNYNKHMKRRHGMDMSKKKITPEGMLQVEPGTGKPMEMAQSVETEEWKKRVMMPSRRGKKEIKQDNIL